MDWQSRDWRTYDELGSEEKMVKKLEEISRSLADLESYLYKIDDKLLHDETPQLLRNLNQIIVIFNKWVLAVAFVFFVAKYF